MRTGAQLQNSVRRRIEIKKEKKRKKEGRERERNRGGEGAENKWSKSICANACIKSRRARRPALDREHEQQGKVLQTKPSLCFF